MGIPDDDHKPILNLIKEMKKPQVSALDSIFNKFIEESEAISGLATIEVKSTF
jgi:hypothetical protein